MICADWRWLCVCVCHNFIWYRCSSELFMFMFPFQNENIFWQILWTVNKNNIKRCHIEMFCYRVAKPCESVSDARFGSTFVWRQVSGTCGVRLYSLVGAYSSFSMNDSYKKRRYATTNIHKIISQALWRYMNNISRCGNKLGVDACVMMRMYRLLPFRHKQNMLLHLLFSLFLPPSCSLSQLNESCLSLRLRC